MGRLKHPLLFAISGPHYEGIQGRDIKGERKVSFLSPKTTILLQVKQDSADLSHRNELRHPGIGTLLVSCG